MVNPSSQDPRLTVTWAGGLPCRGAPTRGLDSGPLRCPASAPGGKGRLLEGPRPSAHVLGKGNGNVALALRPAFGRPSRTTKHGAIHVIEERALDVSGDIEVFEQAKLVEDITEHRPGLRKLRSTQLEADEQWECCCMGGAEDFLRGIVLASVRAAKAFEESNPTKAFGAMHPVAPTTLGLFAWTERGSSGAVKELLIEGRLAHAIKGGLGHPRHGPEGGLEELAGVLSGGKEPFRFLSSLVITLVLRDRDPSELHEIMDLVPCNVLMEQFLSACRCIAASNASKGGASDSVKTFFQCVLCCGHCAVHAFPRKHGKNFVCNRASASRGQGRSGGRSWENKGDGRPVDRGHALGAGRVKAYSPKGSLGTLLL